MLILARPSQPLNPYPALQTRIVVFMYLNADFLKKSDRFLRLLHRIVSEPDFFADLLKRFCERAESLRAAQKLDPQQLQDTLMNELFENYASKMAERN